MPDRLTRITTALAVGIVATVAAVISYRHAYELVRTHGESGITARLVPFTVDGLIWAASMVILDAGRRKQSVPTLAKWSLGVGIGANVAHVLNHGPIGALVSAWPALAFGRFIRATDDAHPNNGATSTNGATRRSERTCVDGARTTPHTTVEQAPRTPPRGPIRRPARAHTTYSDLGLPPNAYPSNHNAHA